MLLRSTTSAAECARSPAPYSLFVFRHVLTKLCDLSTAKDITWRSDGGRHFRSATSISTMAARGVSLLCDRSSHTDHCHVAEVNFGIPCHCSTIVTAQSQLRQILHQVCKKKIVSGVSDMVTECRNI